MSEIDGSQIGLYIPEPAGPYLPSHNIQELTNKARAGLFGIIAGVLGPHHTLNILPRARLENGQEQREQVIMAVPALPNHDTVVAVVAAIREQYSDFQHNTIPAAALPYVPQFQPIE